MTNEELMTPRFKVIDDYPNSLFKIDEILTNNERIFCDENSKRYSDFPNIFKPLEWWEERELTDFPKYLKEEYSNIVIKVENYYLKYHKIHFRYFDLEIQNFSNEYIYDFIPSTEEEYLEYIKTLEK